MNTIEELMSSLMGDLNKPIPVINPNFYVQIDKTKLIILSISPTKTVSDNIENIEIEYDLAIKFLSGEENINHWVVGYKAEVLSIQKIDPTQGVKYNRVDVQSIVEIVAKEMDNPDIWIIKNLERDEIEIHYDGSKISTWDRTAKIYITRENDPSVLKVAFSLDNKILDIIIGKNKLADWPNPIYLSVPNVDDTSIYTFKSNLKIDLIQPHEILDN